MFVLQLAVMSVYIAFFHKYKLEKLAVWSAACNFFSVIPGSFLGKPSLWFQYL